MARFSGKIGFIKSKETEPGVWENETIERTYYGDITRAVRRWDKSENINDDVNVNNSISIVADSYIYNNIYAMKYIRWMGALWKIESFEIQRPRISLTIGGLYNGEQA